jgi:tRNA modification GTPase
MPSIETICALATPVGEGAVGMVRLSGPRVLEMVEAVCRRHGQGFIPRRMHAVQLVDRRGEAVDRALVCFMPGPRSYTGEDVAEVYGHGGVLNMERILSLFLSLGARAAEPGEFTRRAFLSGRIDLAQAEAVAQVVVARSERALQNAQRLLSGALGERVREIRRDLVRLTAQLEAGIDFSDDLEQGIDIAEVVEGHGIAARALGELARSYRQGKRLDGIRVGIVGPVNAGKSSLFNCLLGAERALVAEEPGTTRDYLEAEVSWQGIRVTLVDTAGERPEEAKTALEQAGQDLARPVVEASDMVLWVVDGSREGALPRGPELRGQGQEGLVVVNKIDLVEGGAGVEGEREGVPVVYTSALTGEGVEEVRGAILRRMFPPGGEQETVQVTRRRQWELLARAERELTDGGRALAVGLPPEVVVEHTRGALVALGQLTGDSFTEEVWDAVFREFCIGK